MEEDASTGSRPSKLRKQTDFALHRRAQEHIAQGYLTNSKRPQSHVMGVFPTHLIKGQGCYVWDHRGRKFMDFICGLGTNLLGYANPSVNAAAIAALDRGNLLSLGSDLEIEAAEKLKTLFPFTERVKFLKTGTQATVAALRIARAYKQLMREKK